MGGGGDSTGSGGGGGSIGAAKLAISASIRVLYSIAIVAQLFKGEQMPSALSKKKVNKNNVG